MTIDVSDVAQSPAVRMLEKLVDTFGPERARAELARVLDAMPISQLAGLAFEWEGFWARPKQFLPRGEWDLWLILTGRGFGKTTMIARAIMPMIERGELRKIGTACQNDKKTYEANIAELIAASPPRFVPDWNATEQKLVWPNGVEAFAYTPEAPGAIRSQNLDLAWISEIQSWPDATRDEAYLNFAFATRKGKARTIVDCTAKKGHPLIKRLLKLTERNPERNRVTRGSMRENLAHLAPSAVKKLIDEFAGTSAGREELDGEMGDETENALWKSTFFWRREVTRRSRSVISIDPAVTKRGGSDLTGIVRAELDVDGIAVVCADRTGKYSPGEWATIVLDDYAEHRCDLVVVETNKGGDLLTQNLRAAAKDRKLDVVVVDKKWTPRHVPGVIHVREIFSRGEKADRAKPTATAYEKNRVAHLEGAELAELETLLTTWEPKPGARSPDRLDALVGAIEELLGLGSEKVDNARSFAGLTEANASLSRGGHRTTGEIVIPRSPSLITSAPASLAAFYRSRSGPKI